MEPPDWWKNKPYLIQSLYGVPKNAGFPDKCHRTQFGCLNVQEPAGFRIRPGDEIHYTSWGPAHVDCAIKTQLEVQEWETEHSTSWPPKDQVERDENDEKKIKVQFTVTVYEDGTFEVEGADVELVTKSTGDTQRELISLIDHFPAQFELVTAIPVPSSKVGRNRYFGWRIVA